MTTPNDAAAASAAIFHVSSPERPKRVAKALAADLKRRGYDRFPYAKCLDLVAKMYGHRDYGALLADVGRHSPSPDDAVAGVEVAALRRKLHVDVLWRARVASDKAAAAVAAVQPTGRADPRHAAAFVHLSDELRSAAPDAPAAAALRRKFYVVLDTSPVAAEKVEAIVGLVGPMGLLTREDVCTIVDAATFLDRNGWSVRDLEPYYQMCLQMTFGGNWDCFGDPLPARTMNAMLAGAGKLSTMTFGLDETHGDTVMDPDAMDAMAEMLIALGVLSMDWHAAAKGQNAGRLQMEAHMDAIRDMADAGVGFAEIAVTCAAECGADGAPLRYDDKEWSETVSNIESWPRALAIPDRAACDAAAEKAVAVMLGRGVPKMFVEKPYFFTDGSFQDTAIARPGGGHVQISDVMLAGQIAGLGIADLVSSALEFAIEATADFRMTKAARERWVDTIEGLRRASARSIPELALAACSFGIKPDFVATPELFARGIEELWKLEEARVTLGDFVAYGLLTLAADREFVSPLALADGEEQSPAPSI
jgi:hypothetical protein